MAPDIHTPLFLVTIGIISLLATATTFVTPEAGYWQILSVPLFALTAGFCFSLLLFRAIPVRRRNRDIEMQPVIRLIVSDEQQGEGERGRPAVAVGGREEVAALGRQMQEVMKREREKDEARRQTMERLEGTHTVNRRQSVFVMDWLSKVVNS